MKTRTRRLIDAVRKIRVRERKDRATYLISALSSRGGTWCCPMRATRLCMHPPRSVSFLHVDTLRPLTGGPTMLKAYGTATAVVASTGMAGNSARWPRSAFPASEMNVGLLHQKESFINCKISTQIVLNLSPSLTIDVLRCYCMK